MQRQKRPPYIQVSSVYVLPYSGYEIESTESYARLKQIDSEILVLKVFPDVSYFLKSDGGYEREQVRDLNNYSTSVQATETLEMENTGIPNNTKVTSHLYNQYLTIMRVRENNLYHRAKRMQASGHVISEEQKEIERNEVEKIGDDLIKNFREDVQKNLSSLKQEESRYQNLVTFQEKLEQILPMLYKLPLIDDAIMLQARNVSENPRQIFAQVKKNQKIIDKKDIQEFDRIKEFVLKAIREIEANISDKDVISTLHTYSAITSGLTGHANQAYQTWNTRDKTSSPEETINLYKFEYGRLLEEYYSSAGIMSLMKDIATKRNLEYSKQIPKNQIEFSSYLTLSPVSPIKRYFSNTNDNKEEFRDLNLLMLPGSLSNKQDLYEEKDCLSTSLFQVENIEQKDLLIGDVEERKDELKSALKTNNGLGKHVSFADIHNEPIKLIHTELIERKEEYRSYDSTDKKVSIPDASQERCCPCTVFSAMGAITNRFAEIESSSSTFQESSFTIFIEENDLTLQKDGREKLEYFKYKKDITYGIKTQKSGDSLMLPGSLIEKSFQTIHHNSADLENRGSSFIEYDHKSSFSDHTGCFMDSLRGALMGANVIFSFYESTNSMGKMMNDFTVHNIIDTSRDVAKYYIAIGGLDLTYQAAQIIGDVGHAAVAYCEDDHTHYEQSVADIKQITTNVLCFYTATVLFPAYSCMIVPAIVVTSGVYEYYNDENHHNDLDSYQESSSSIKDYCAHNSLCESIVEGIEYYIS